MIIRHFTVASMLSLALLSLPGSALTTKAGALDYCKADAGRLCPGVEGPKALGCLKEHKMEVSVGCAKALQKIKAEMGK